MGFTLGSLDHLVLTVEDPARSIVVEIANRAP